MRAAAPRPPEPKLTAPTATILTEYVARAIVAAELRLILAAGVQLDPALGLRQTEQRAVQQIIRRHLDRIEDAMQVRRSELLAHPRGRAALEGLAAMFEEA